MIGNSWSTLSDSTAFGIKLYCKNFFPQLFLIPIIQDRRIESSIDSIELDTYGNKSTISCSFLTLYSSDRESLF